MEIIYGGVFIFYFLHMELFQQLCYVHTAARYPNYSLNNEICNSTMLKIPTVLSDSSVTGCNVQYRLGNFYKNNADHLK